MRKIKIGIFGTNMRGVDLSRNFMMLNCDIVAVCETNPDKAEYGKKFFGDIPMYGDFDEFLESGVEAVVLANYFHEHTPYAIKCFEKGIHVFSECISNSTMAEGVQLARAFKNTSSIYFLAENYPQMLFNLEMQKVCKGGSLGKILYAEGEYNHPADPEDTTFKKDYNYFEKHWRNHLPRTYYITHSLGPIMRATGATPETVTAFAAFAPVEGDVPTASYVGDRVAVIMTQNDDGSIFRVTGHASFGAHHNSYRICGTEGQIENPRGMGNKVMLRYNDWSKPDNIEEAERLYEPQWNDKDEELIKTAGHGGSDYITARMFINCIIENRQPEHPFNLKSAIAMSSVAILSHRSMLEGGKPYRIPDFDNAEDVELYKNDTLSPFYYSDGTEPTIPCCSKTDFKPTEQQLEKYKKDVIGITE